MDTPPIQEKTFRPHATVKGSLAIESFDTFQTIGEKSSTYTINPLIKTRGIKDAWMYIHVIGYDSVAEKWNIRLNDYSLAYRVHTEPSAEFESSQLIRFDVRDFIKEGQNKLYIEGAEFNIGDQYFLTGVTFVLVYDSDEKTEFWINENANFFGGGTFETINDAKLYGIYLKGNQDPQLELNNNLLLTTDIEPVHIIETTSFSTWVESDISNKISRENILSGDTPSLTIVAVTSDDINVQPEEPEKEIDQHQAFVIDFLDQQKFDQLGMVYYRNSLPPDFDLS
jgi:hypothetical protein